MQEAFFEIEEDQTYALPLECDEGRRTDHYNKVAVNGNMQNRESYTHATAGNMSGSRAS